MIRRSQKLLTRFARNKRGVAAIEFAFVALPFFAIMIAVFQIGLVYLAENELETATESAARQLLTGQVQNNGVTRSQFIASICSNLPVYFSCSGVMVDLQTVSAFASADVSAPKLTYDSQGNVTNKWNFTTGSAGSILVLRVIYQFPIFLGPLGLDLANLPNGKHLMMTTAVFEVEPYNQSGS